MPIDTSRLAADLAAIRTDLGQTLIWEASDGSALSTLSCMWDSGEVTDDFASGMEGISEGRPMEVIVGFSAALDGLVAGQILKNAANGKKYRVLGRKDSSDGVQITLRCEALTK